jgi:lambda family phage portal protein
VGLFTRIFGRERRQATALATGGGYEASRLGRRMKGWVAERRGINALLAAGGEQLRARARQLCRENPYASAAVESFVAAAVGTGIKPSSLIEDREMKEAVQAAWLRWTDEADADGLTDLYGLQALAARAMFEAGECFVRFRPRRVEDGLSVPLQLQIIEAEMLPLSDNRDLGTGRILRCGIEFDGIGRRRAYHFLRNHPGEMNLGGAFSMDRAEVPASEVLHIYRPLRPGQIRGQPEITPAMIRLYLLDQYDDAELDRKRTAAMYAGFVTRPAEETVNPVVPVESKDGENAVAALEPGTLQMLLPGEDVKFSEPAEVGGSYEAFQYRTLLAIASAAGVPYHAMTSDVGRANYSSLRASQVEFRRRMDQFQHATLVYQLCRPIWRRWYETAVMAGAIRGLSATAFRRDAEALLAAKWIPPKWEWVDPLKDMQAEKLAVDSGWKPRSDVVEAGGYDVEEVDARIAADKAREAELGLSFPPLPAGAYGAPASEGGGNVVPFPNRA